MSCAISCGSPSGAPSAPRRIEETGGRHSRRRPSPGERRRRSPRSCARARGTRPAGDAGERHRLADRGAGLDVGQDEALLGVPARTDEQLVEREDRGLIRPVDRLRVELALRAAYAPAELKPVAMRQTTTDRACMCALYIARWSRYRARCGSRAVGHLVFAATLITLGVLGLVKGGLRPDLGADAAGCAGARGAGVSDRRVSLAAGIGLVVRRTAGHARTRAARPAGDLGAGCSACGPSSSCPGVFGAWTAAPRPS